MGSREISVYIYIQGGPRQSRPKRNPLSGGYRIGCVGQKFPILTMPSQANPLSRAIQGDLISVESVSACPGIRHAHDQPGIPIRSVVEKQFHTRFTIENGLHFAEELRAAASGSQQVLPFVVPFSFDGAKPLRGNSRRRFLKTFPEEHLAVQTAVNFVVDVLDTSAGQQARHTVNGLRGIHHHARRTFGVACEDWHDKNGAPNQRGEHAEASRHEQGFSCGRMVFHRASLLCGPSVFSADRVIMAQTIESQYSGKELDAGLRMGTMSLASCLMEFSNRENL